jgi:hypothetical protein
MFIRAEKMEKKFYEKVKYYEWPHPEDTASTLR